MNGAVSIKGVRFLYRDGAECIITTFSNVCAYRLVAASASVRIIAAATLIVEKP